MAASSKSSLIGHQTLPEEMHVVHGVATPVIEGKNGIIVLADTDTDLGTTKVNKKRLGTLHQTRAHSRALEFRRHGKIVDAAAMTVIPDHDRRDDIF